MFILTPARRAPSSDAPLLLYPTTYSPEAKDSSDLRNCGPSSLPSVTGHHLSDPSARSNDHSCVSSLSRPVCAFLLLLISTSTLVAHKPSSHILMHKLSVSKLMCHSWQRLIVWSMNHISFLGTASTSPKPTRKVIQGLSHTQSLLSTGHP